MIYYVIFSYLVLVGIESQKEIASLWNFALAPITFPIMIGMFLAKVSKSL